MTSLIHQIIQRVSKIKNKNNKVLLVGTVGGFIGELWMIFVCVFKEFPDFEKPENVILLRNILNIYKKIFRL